MTTAAELREALTDDDVLPVADGTTLAVGSLGEDSVLLPERQWRTLRDAARTIALPILEADSELVERVRLAIDKRWRYRQLLDHAEASRIETMANRVLAAISTPTPGAE